MRGWGAGLAKTLASPCVPQCLVAGQELKTEARRGPGPPALHAGFVVFRAAPERLWDFP